LRGRRGPRRPLATSCRSARSCRRVSTGTVRTCGAAPHAASKCGSRPRRRLSRDRLCRAADGAPIRHRRSGPGKSRGLRGTLQRRDEPAGTRATRRSFSSTTRPRWRSGRIRGPRDSRVVAGRTLLSAMLGSITPAQRTVESSPRTSSRPRRRSRRSATSSRSAGFGSEVERPPLPGREFRSSSRLVRWRRERWSLRAARRDAWARTGAAVQRRRPRRDRSIYGSHCDSGRRVRDGAGRRRDLIPRARSSRSSTELIAPGAPVPPGRRALAGAVRGLSRSVRVSTSTTSTRTFDALGLTGQARERIWIWAHGRRTACECSPARRCDPTRGPYHVFVRSERDRTCGGRPPALAARLREVVPTRARGQCTRRSCIDDHVTCRQRNTLSHRDTADVMWSTRASSCEAHSRARACARVQHAALAVRAVQCGRASTSGARRAKEGGTHWFLAARRPVCMEAACCVTGRSAPRRVSASPRISAGRRRGAAPPGSGALRRMPVPSTTCRTAAASRAGSPRCAAPLSPNAYA